MKLDRICCGVPSSAGGGGGGSRTPNDFAGGGPGGGGGGGTGIFQATSRTSNVCTTKLVLACPSKNISELLACIQGNLLTKKWAPSVDRRCSILKLQAVQHCFDHSSNIPQAVRHCCSFSSSVSSHILAFLDFSAGVFPLRAKKQKSCFQYMQDMGM